MTETRYYIWVKLRDQQKLELWDITATCASALNETRKLRDGTYPTRPVGSIEEIRIDQTIAVWKGPE
jgi:hypothetical protein